ncbi:aminodeoxychorismate lyase [Bacillus sp. ISL-47]|uniref:aminodeoxychorismate lyase n=1 Tax=Bacillus sp. ISL-47 TaxID=2819130 RepID=UPI001BE9B6C9|nr:aminodeoxychorismate lyase [Bacillus sp. ISL-47]MBT2688738.1 aminodeoxychorismate lyase [Bacillus sp. ISL-47]MBT2709561.1 aminodeoxychorismate lyase [Pseudomonas sp. ISL-84]
MYIYLNGDVIKKEEAAISPFDHGFLYGMGLFETFRVYNGHPFLLDDHLDRLNQGLEVLNIEASFTRGQVAEALDKLLEKNGFKNAYIRMNVSAGTGEIGLQTDAYKKPNTIIFCKPLPPRMPRQEKRAVRLKIPRNTPEGEERLKSHHYLNNILAKREAGKDPDIEGVFLTKEGFLAEGVVSNLFWIKDHLLFTPSIETGILNGITRKFVIRLAEAMGLSVREGLYRPEDVWKANEAFVTNSIQEIVPISSFDGHPLPGLSGEITSKLLSYYERQCERLWSRKEM